MPGLTWRSFPALRGRGVYYYHTMPRPACTIPSDGWLPACISARLSRTAPTPHNTYHHTTAHHHLTHYPPTCTPIPTPHTRWPAPPLQHLPSCHFCCLNSQLLVCAVLPVIVGCAHTHTPPQQHAPHHTPQDLPLGGTFDTPHHQQTRLGLHSGYLGVWRGTGCCWRRTHAHSSTRPSLDLAEPTARHFILYGHCWYSPLVGRTRRAAWPCCGRGGPVFFCGVVPIKRPAGAAAPFRPADSGDYSALSPATLPVGCSPRLHPPPHTPPPSPRPLPTLPCQPFNLRPKYTRDGLAWPGPGPFRCAGLPVGTDLDLQLCGTWVKHYHSFVPISMTDIPTSAPTLPTPPDLPPAQSLSLSGTASLPLPVGNAITRADSPATHAHAHHRYTPTPHHTHTHTAAALSGWY